MKFRLGGKERGEKINSRVNYEGIQRTRFYGSRCCLSVTENPRIFHMSIRDVQTFPAKYEDQFANDLTVTTENKRNSEKIR